MEILVCSSLFFGIYSLAPCGPLSDLNFVNFIWDHSERLSFVKYAILLFPSHTDRPPPLLWLFLKYHKARSDGWTDIDGCITCVERYQRSIRHHNNCRPPDSCYCDICRRQPPSLRDSSHILFQYILDLERFELTCYTTYSQYQYAVQSGRVDDLRLLPPEFPFIRVMFRFHTFENKFHRHCPGRGEWNTIMTASFVNVATAVTCLANDERLYRCKHCKRGLFFPYICTGHSDGH